GGIGVELDGEYRLDLRVDDRDDDIEERIALMAGLGGFEIPAERAGDRIFVLGKTLRTSDLSYGDLDPLPEILPELDSSRLLNLPLYTNGVIKRGARFGSIESGVLLTSRAGVPAAYLVDESGAQRYPTRAGTAMSSGSELTAHEVDSLLDSILLTAFRTRAAIRRPLDTAARVSIWIVDPQGVVLGMIRTDDAPVFGIDVALQKARTAAFFSSADAGEKLNAVRVRNGIGAFADYVGAVRALLGPTALTGTHAFSDRAGGNLSRPFFLDGIDGNSNGPFSLPFPGTAPGRTWSPFNTGLQLDLVFQRLVQPLGIPS
ncbi:MAG: heme-binding protein, partial [Bdellovibrionales bacterium]|nr:heme-binding protein [Bdellovibrionales bacterium]